MKEISFGEKASSTVTCEYNEMAHCYTFPTKEKTLLIVHSADAANADNELGVLVFAGLTDYRSVYPI